MNILICGDRNYTDFGEIGHFLQSLLLEFKPNEVTVIEGGCTGADSIAGFAAKGLGMNVIEEKADWNKYGKSAGPIRNQLMLDKYKPNLIVAFHNDLEHSKGTKDMVERAKNQGFYTKVFSTVCEENKP